MDVDWFRRILREEIASAIKSTQLEVIEVCPGHMGTTYYYLITKYQDQVIAKLCIGDDGFNDGDKLGFSFRSTRSVKSEKDI